MESNKLALFPKRKTFDIITYIQVEGEKEREKQNFVPGVANVIN